MATDSWGHMARVYHCREHHMKQPPTGHPTLHARALPPEVVYIEHAGPRGAKTWEPISQRMDRGDQLELF